MDGKRLVWIVVIVLFVTVAFVGGFALGTWNSARRQYGGAYGFAPGLGARGFAPSGIFMPTVPFTRSVPFGFAPGSRMQPGFGMGYGMMPGYDRGGQMQPRFAPGYGMRGMPRGFGRMPGRSAPGNRRGGWR